MCLSRSGAIGLVSSDWCPGSLRPGLEVPRGPKVKENHTPHGASATNRGQRHMAPRRAARSPPPARQARTGFDLFVEAGVWWHGALFVAFETTLAVLTVAVLPGWEAPEDYDVRATLGLVERAAAFVSAAAFLSFFVQRTASSARVGLLRRAR
jgi:hypothetical protein